MALRNILTEGDPTLNKTSRPVVKFDNRLHVLLDDMAETLNTSNGVGLAAPQVGVLRRVVLVVETNVPEGEEEFIIELINPEIISAEGEQRGSEGCLSVPDQFGIVTRPEKVTVRAQNRRTSRPMKSGGLETTIRSGASVAAEASAAQFFANRQWLQIRFRQMFRR